MLPQKYLSIAPTISITHAVPRMDDDDDVYYPRGLRMVVRRFHHETNAMSLSLMRCRKVDG